MRSALASESFPYLTGIKVWCAVARRSSISTVLPVRRNYRAYSGADLRLHPAGSGVSFISTRTAMTTRAAR